MWTKFGNRALLGAIVGLCGIKTHQLVWRREARRLDVLHDRLSVVSRQPEVKSRTDYLATSFHSMNLSSDDIPMLGAFDLHRNYRRALHSTLALDLSGAIQEGDQIVRQHHQRIQSNASDRDPVVDAVLEIAESLAQPTPKQLVAMRKCIGPNDANNWFVFRRGVQQLDVIIESLEDFHHPDNGSQTALQRSTVEQTWLYAA
jgi:hypothetical protein